MSSAASKGFEARNGLTAYVRPLASRGVCSFSCDTRESALGGLHTGLCWVSSDTGQGCGAWRHCWAPLLCPSGVSGSPPPKAGLGTRPQVGLSLG